MSTVPTVEIESSDVTAEIASRSLRWNLNTLDFRLVDPSSVPALGDAVTVDTPAWSGDVTNVQTEEDDRGTILWAKVTATNTDTAGASAAPFGLSDTPNGTTTFGYRKLKVTNTRTSSGDSQRAELDCWEEGLLPGQTVALTNAQHGFSATDFTVVDVRVGWDRPDAAVYHVILGDAIVTMSVWVNSAEAGILPITSTKITDGSVTTPKLDANAVTAAKIAAGTITATELAANAITTRELAVGGAGTGNLIVNGSFEDGEGTAHTAFQTASDDLDGWSLLNNAKVQFVASAVARTGSYVCSLASNDGTTSLPSLYQYVPVIAGKTYRLSGFLNKSVSGGVQFRLRANTYDKDKALVTANVISLGNSTSSTQTLYSGTYTVPTDGTVSYLFVEILYVGTPTTSERIVAEDVILQSADLTTANGSVVIDSSGVTITNGALTVNNGAPGVGDVIIDGTSNMFKIAATSTSTFPTAGANSSATSSVTVDTTLTYRPAIMGYLLSGSSAITLPYLYYYAATSLAVYYAYMYSQVYATSKTKLFFSVDNGAGTSQGGWSVRYYILKEAAI